MVMFFPLLDYFLTWVRGEWNWGKVMIDDEVVIRGDGITSPPFVEIDGPLPVQTWGSSRSCAEDGGAAGLGLAGQLISSGR